MSLTATTADGTSIDLDWQATDPGAGLATCTLQYRLNDGNLQPHSGQCVGAETFDAQPGHTYTFRPLASLERDSDRPAPLALVLFSVGNLTLRCRANHVSHAEQGQVW